MKDVTDIFLINEENLLELNKLEIRTVKEFRDILIRDKGKKIDGDYDGRRKFYAFKELMYVYLYNHPLSIYRDLPDEVKHLRCVEHCELESNWKVDKIIKAANKKFLVLVNMSALQHSYVNANKGVYSLGEDLEFFNNFRDKIRENIKEKQKILENTKLEEDILKLEGEIDHLTTRLMDLGIKINNITNSLPIAFDTVEKLKKALMKETNQGGKVYGGGEVHSREKE